MKRCSAATAHVISLILCLAWLLSTALFAQSFTASVQGIVTDSSGALAPTGSYALTVEKPGFPTFWLPWTTSLDGGVTRYASLSNPYPAGVPQPAGAKLGLGTAVGGSMIADLRGWATKPYSQQWSLSIQRELPANSVAEIAYSANQGVNLYNAQMAALNRIDTKNWALGDSLNDMVPNPFYGSYPKSVVALEALWMLELARQSGFPERARHRVSAPAKTGNVDDADFFDPLGTNAGLSEHSEPALGAESAPGSSESREIWHAKGGVGPGPGHSRRPGRPFVLQGAHNALIEKCLSPITLLGQGPVLWCDCRSDVGVEQAGRPAHSASTALSPVHGSQNDHLRLKFAKRFRHGLSLSGHYTFSKMIDNNSLSGGNLTSWGGFTYLQSYGNQHLGRSVSLFDQPHRVVADFTYELPFGLGKAFGPTWNRFVDAILGQWHVNGILEYHSGFPLTTALLGGILPDSTQRPNPISDPGLTGSVESRLDRYLNPDVFARPAPYTLGNAPRNLSSVRAPSFRNLDASIFKSLALTDDGKRYLQLRLEAFNATNTPIFGAPSMNVGDTSFGVISSQANTPRELQIDAKIYF